MAAFYEGYRWFHLVWPPSCYSSRHVLSAREAPVAVGCGSTSLLLWYCTCMIGTGTCVLCSGSLQRYVSLISSSISGAADNYRLCLLLEREEYIRHTFVDMADIHLRVSMRLPLIYQVWLIIHYRDILIPANTIRCTITAALTDIVLSVSNVNI